MNQKFKLRLNYSEMAMIPDHITQWIHFDDKVQFPNFCEKRYSLVAVKVLPITDTEFWWFCCTVNNRFQRATKTFLLKTIKHS